MYTEDLLHGSDEVLRHEFRVGYLDGRYFLVDVSEYTDGDVDWVDVYDLYDKYRNDDLGSLCGLVESFRVALGREVIKLDSLDFRDYEWGIDPS